MNDFDSHRPLLVKSDSGINSNRGMSSYDTNLNVCNEVFGEQKFYESVDVFDTDFLESLREINEDTVEQEFKNSIDRFNVLTDTLRECNRASVEEEVSDSIDVFEDKYLGFDHCNTSSLAMSIPTQTVEQHKDIEKIFDPIVAPSNPFRVEEILKISATSKSTSSSKTKETTTSAPAIEDSATPSHHPVHTAEVTSNHKFVESVMKSEFPFDNHNETSDPSTIYKDYADVSDEEAGVNLKYTCMRGRAQETFPVKLHSIVESSDRHGYSSIISWCAHGRGFKIHNQHLFLENILKRFFFQTKMSSFTRQLGMYGFHKIIGKKNPDRGAFFHELFLRSRPGLCKTMVRLRKRSILDSEQEPNLTLYSPLPYAKHDHMTPSLPTPVATTYPKEIRYTNTASATSAGETKPLPYLIRSADHRNSLTQVQPLLTTSLPTAHTGSMSYLSIQQANIRAAAAAANAPTAIPAAHNQISYIPQHQLSQLMTTPMLQPMTQVIQHGGAMHNQQPVQAVPCIIIRTLPM